jgi:hypothetical protein
VGQRRQGFSDATLAEADAYAKIRAEALRRAENTVNPERRKAFLEVAEYCDQQEQQSLNHREKS